jgi:hypothetical protein
VITLCGATPWSTTDASAVCAPAAPGSTATVDEIDDAATIRKTFVTDTGTWNACMNVAFTPIRAAYDTASTPTTSMRKTRGRDRIAPPSFAFSQVVLKRR